MLPTPDFPPSPPTQTLMRDPERLQRVLEANPALVQVLKKQLGS